MANEQNIIPNSERTPQQREEIARAGGIASGAARRAKRNLREIFEAIRTEQITVAMPDKSTRTMQMDEAAALAMYQQALKGNVKAMTLVATLLGEYEQKVKVEGVNPVLVTKEEREAIGKWAKKKAEE